VRLFAFLEYENRTAKIRKKHKHTDKDFPVRRSKKGTQNSPMFDIDRNTSLQIRIVNISL